MLKQVHYAFSINADFKNFVDVNVLFPVDSDRLTIHLPSWRPGRYELGNFSRNVRTLGAKDLQGNKLLVYKKDKNTWEIEGIIRNEIIISYQYFANELNAGSTYTDGTFLYVNPVNCAIYSQKSVNLPCEIAVDVPSQWQIAGIQKVNNKFLFSNFDELADSPFIASEDLINHCYSIDEVEFTLWFHRQKNIPWKKLVTDFSKFSEKLIQDFGDLPTKKFEFIILSLPYVAYHGVEHLKSTVITLGPSHELFGNLYSELLGVSCHELYHVWNVKTIRPKDFFPYDFSKENYSQLGFIYEGITTYFGDLYLLKSGIFSIQQYLIELSEQFQKHADNFGRFNYSLADSSIDTWVDGYVPGIPARKVSIYTEGCLLALWLDNKILAASENKENLQSVMSLIYRTYGKQKIGIDLSIFIDSITEITKSDFSVELKRFLFYPTDFINELSTTLTDLGLELIQTDGTSSEKLLGIKTNHSANSTYITNIHPQGTGAVCGLNTGDELIAMNGAKIKGDLDKWLSYFSIPFDITVIRNNQVLSIKIENISLKGFSKYQLKLNEQLTSNQKARFNSWTGTSKK